MTAAARAAGAATIFYSIIDAPKPDIGGVKGPDVTATEDIVLDHINFAYPTRPHIKVLDDLTLRFPAGKVTAIVGPSGSGKSTIVGLIERWYELDGDPAQNLIVSRWITIISLSVSNKDSHRHCGCETVRLRQVVVHSRIST